MSRIIGALLEDLTRELSGKMEQDALMDYDMSNEDAFWLSQVAEDGSLPTPKDEALAKKLRYHGLVTVKPKFRRYRDQSLDQVYFLTYRGDVMMRAYQAYRARRA